MIETATLQTDAVAQIGPYALTLLVGLIGGSLAPTYYAAERLRGAGRAVVARIPYRPPPGVDEQEAMQQAASADAAPGGVDDQPPDGSGESGDADG